MRPPSADETLIHRGGATDAMVRRDNDVGFIYCMRQWFGGLWKGLFFLAAIVVFVAGILGIIGGMQLFLSPFTMCNQIFLCIFGAVMLIIDFPAEFHSLEELKFSVWRYLLFMTRFTGRGVWYLYLSTMIWSALYNLNVDPLLGFVGATFCAVLGVMSIFYGLQKSFKLERARQGIAALGLDAANKLCPHRGLSLTEFNDVCKRVCGFSFSGEELEYIAAALSHSIRSDDIISREEFWAWTGGSMTIM